jgi:cytochrome b561
VAIILHWLIAAMVMANLAGGLSAEWFFESPDPARVAQGKAVMALHKSLGLLVILLTLGRIGWRLGHAPPPWPAHMTPLERRLAGTTHLIFYALLLALPLSGWAMLSTGRTVVPVSVFGWFAVPPLPVPQALSDSFQTAHHQFGWAMLVLLGVHVLATLKHRIFDREPLLARMSWRRAR